MVEVILGSSSEKPVSSKLLAEAVTSLRVDGYLYLGYPIIGSPTGPMRLDALLVSPTLGLVAFDLVEGTELKQYQSRQDEIASMLEVRLKPYSELKNKRELAFDVNVVTYAPAKTHLPASEPPYYIANAINFSATVSQFEWGNTDNTYKNLVAAIQVITSIRAGKLKREPTRPDSKGARLCAATRAFLHKASTQTCS